MSSPEEVLETIDEGKANRHVAVTSKCSLARSIARSAPAAPVLAAVAHSARLGWLAVVAAAAESRCCHRRHRR